MNRKKYLILTTMLSLLCINKTYAACTQQEINDFKKIEDEYKITYKFDKETKTYTLELQRGNYEMYDYRFYVNGELQCSDLNKKTAKCYYFSPGTYRVDIVGNTKMCTDILKTINLKLIKYNKYSEDPLCEGIEEFVLCQPTYEKEIDYDTFVSRVNTYKKSKTEANNEEDPPKKENLYLDKIKLYIKENIIQIVIITIFVILVTISTIIGIKSIKKSRRLE